MGAGQKRVTVQDLRGRKAASGASRIVALTCYDYTFARWVDEWVDLVLVGDSLGMVIQGQDTTLAVTLEEMIYHCRAVGRGLSRAHLVADLPFMSYQPSVKTALISAGRLLKEAGAHSVKLEGGAEVAPTVARLVEAGIPVLGHIGLMPQRVHAMGGYKVQGRTEEGRQAILADAVALEQAGVYGIVLEGIPKSLAREVTERVKVPTIGIGAGVHCDGQVLVQQDMLGLNRDFEPKFVKRYAQLGESVAQAVRAYAEEVRAAAFPSDEHSFE